MPLVSPAQHTSVRQLLEAIQQVLDERPAGIPEPVIAGLQNLSEGLRSRPEGDMSPGAREAAAVARESQPEGLEDDVRNSGAISNATPGRRAALGQ